MKFVIPVDFSEVSLNGMQYGIETAAALGAEVCLVNIISLQAPPRATMNMKELYDSMAADSTKRFEDITKEVNSKKPGLKISHQVVKGDSVLFGMEQLMQNTTFDMVVMGTSGAGGLKKLLLGSNAADMCANSPIPVLVVPNGCVFNRPENIVYATDLQNFDNELKEVVKLAGTFNAKINVLHAESGVKADKEKTNHVKNQVVLDHKYPFIEITFSDTADLKTAINEQIEATSADWLIMFTHKLNLWEKLTGKGNTKGIAMDINIPLLAIKK